MEGTGALDNGLVMLTRAQFLRLAAAASIGGAFDKTWLRDISAYAQDSGPEPPEALSRRASRLIEAYDRQGIHRTATEVDHQSAAWLANEAREAGADAGLEAFAIKRVDIRAAYIESDGRRAAALPLFDGTFTDDAGISGALGPSGSSAPIALLSADAGQISSEGRGFSAPRRSGTHKALVIVTRGAHEGLTPMNAADFASPYGCPAVQVASDDEPWLTDLAHRGGTIRVVADAVRVDATASNVVASIPGRRAELAPVVVITPRSGWWQCASERGGGIACWIEAMRAVAASRPARTVRFVASSGHELGHFGLDAYLDRQPGLIGGAAAWVHLGANIGAAGGRARLQAAHDDIEAVATAALTKAGVPPPQRVPRGTVPGGEARNIHVGGGRYVSLLGSSPVFHSQTDRWPAAVDVDAVARYARAFAEVTVALSTQE
jgi:hypothetical protein